MLPIGLISAVPSEGKIILENLKGIKTRENGGITFYRGRIWGKDVVYLAAGIGKTNASHATTVLIEKHSPAMIILFGGGGAYTQSGLKIGDIAVAEKEVYGDEGVLLKDGFQTSELIGIPLLVKGRRKYFNEFPLDKRFVKQAVSSSKLVTRYSPQAKACGCVTKVRSGTFVTVSTCSGTMKRAKELEKRFNAICENMEGAAIAHVCDIYGIPMVEIRGISNIVEERDTSKWNLKLAAENCQRAVMEVIIRGSRG